MGNTQLIYMSGNLITLVNKYLGIL